MADLDSIKFYGVSSYGINGIAVKRKVRDGLFKSHVSRTRIRLFFYVKDGRAYEFFTKEDISDLFPVEKLPTSKPLYSLFNTCSDVFPFDAATFASYTKDYKDATPKEISVALADYRAERKAALDAAAKAKADEEAKRQADLDWLNRSL